MYVPFDTVAGDGKIHPESEEPTMSWEPVERWGNRAQIPLTLGGYVGWAYILWPRGAVLFGSPKDVNWQAVLAAMIVLVGLLTTAAHAMPWLQNRPAAPSSTRVDLISTRSEIQSPLPAFNPMPVGDRELFARPDSPDLENAGKWLRKIEQQWKECIVVLKAFAERWNRYASNFPAIQFRIGMVRDAERDIERARDAVAKELESLLKLFGGPQEHRGPKELWGPLQDHERSALSRGIQLLGTHFISIACSGNVDCMKRANEFVDIFTTAGWTTHFMGPKGYAAMGAEAVLVQGKESSSLAHDLSNLLGAILGGTITDRLGLSGASEIDLLLVIGPKPPQDWK
jgi:hypothetical protein